MTIREASELINKSKETLDNKIIINNFTKLYYCRDYNSYCIEIDNKYFIVKNKQIAINLIKCGYFYEKHLSIIHKIINFCKDNYNNENVKNYSTCCDFWLGKNSKHFYELNQYELIKYFRLDWLNKRNKDGIMDVLDIIL